MLQTSPEIPCTVSVSEALSELNRIAPQAPFLALGQTVFWDEPMKAGIALQDRLLGGSRKLIAGVHDTDYFAKLPSGQRREGDFIAVPHNDTTTKGLWSAAAEFSRLFGSETVVTRDMLLAAGLRLEKIAKGRPSFLDEATEAWGWRGIVSLDEDAPITADVAISNLFPELKATLDWAIDMTLQSVCEPQRLVSTQRAEHLKALVSQAFEEDPSASVADFYKRILPALYRYSSGSTVDVETTKTTDLLKFNRKTCSQPRFDLVNLFVGPESASVARASYDEALRGSEIYSLDRFGTGAIPFDLVIPGRGRGTIRVAPRAVVIMTHEPQFISIKSPLRHVQDLAEAITAKLGPDCVLIGKAVTLIGMLAREFVFVFHEGASSYVKHTRRFHRLLEQRNFGLKMNPILRVRLAAWDALSECNTWFRLPEPFQGPFGTEELTAPSFAARWHDVGIEQESLLPELGRLRSPLDLIRFLESKSGGSWHCLAHEYGMLHDKLERVEREIEQLKKERRQCYEELRALKQERVRAERALGDHFRAAVFQKDPTSEAARERESLKHKVEKTVHSVTNKKKEIRELLRRQGQFVAAPEIRSIHERRRAIELEAELKRLRLIRQAVIASKGLIKANYRPSAWWFPILCPDGGWFRSSIEAAQCYLEML